MPAVVPPAHPNTLFVYGTLMRGFNNPYARQLRRQSLFMGRAQLAGRLYRVSWYPAAVPDEQADTHVQGELYQLHNPAVTLPVLDDYEGVLPDGTGLYQRVTALVRINGALRGCWLYAYNESTANLVPIDSGLFTG